MIHIGNCMDVLPTLETGSVHTCVTSPPYFGLRDYGCDGQIGLEPTPSGFVQALVQVFREVRRILRDDGTVWLNLGDSYTPVNRGENAQPRRLLGGPSLQGVHFSADLPTRRDSIRGIAEEGFKQKDIMGIPWRVAFALQEDGWYLRQDIIWNKPNPMPESVTDRCTKSHEYIFLLSKSAHYYFDADAIKEPVAASSVARLSQDVESQRGSERVVGKINGNMKAVRGKANSFKRENSKREHPIHSQNVGTHRPGRAESEYDLDTRNKRSVWTVPTMPFKEAHFATFPEALIEPCILAGAPAGGIVLDPFIGAGTVAVVATRLGRQYVGSELNPEYAEIARRRLEGTTRGFGF